MKPGVAHPGSTGKASVTGPHDENRVVEATGTLTGADPGMPLVNRKYRPAIR